MAAAWNFCRPVRHITLSTPGVLAPRLVVTRRTAHNLAARECVSNHCRAEALRRSPFLIALAIRTCSRRTCCSMALQWRAFQFPGGLKDASVPSRTVICFSFFTMVLLVLLPVETRPTWAYPVHYTRALASSVLSVLWLLTRLAVRSARRESRRARQLFHVPQQSRVMI